jgi:hypothetical protein
MARNIALAAEDAADREWELICAADEAGMSVEDYRAACRKAQDEAKLERYLSSLDD